MVLTQKKHKNMGRKQGGKIRQHVPPSSDPTDIASTFSPSWTSMLLRPAIAAAGSLAYGYYFDNRIFASNKELMRAGILAGAVASCNTVGNMILPDAFITKANGTRDVDSMAIEAVTTGLLYTGGTYFFVDENVNDLIPAFTKGALLDLGAGVTEGVVTTLL